MSLKYLLTPHYQGASSKEMVWQQKELDTMVLNQATKRRQESMNQILNKSISLNRFYSNNVNIIIVPET